MADPLLCLQASFVALADESFTGLMQQPVLQQMSAAQRWLSHAVPCRQVLEIFVNFMFHSCLLNNPINGPVPECLNA